jgi:hypothetical protein
MNRPRFRIEALIAAIARSPIFLARGSGRLPIGYDDADIAILEWIAAEGQRLGRSVRMM